ncbi:MAG: hypothetical protein NXI22_22305 [bacterium]|nr:hypothetical protein [bacterium]
MAEMIIRLVVDPDTGKKNIVVKLHSDADALPHEHEQQHRALVEKLIEGGVVDASEVGDVIIEREEEASEPAAESSPTDPPQRDAQSQGQ